MIRRDIMRGTLAIVLLLAFTTALAALFRWAVPEQNKETLTYMLGQLSGMVTTALAFYFATSKSSADKNDLIDRITDSGGGQASADAPPVDGARPAQSLARQPGDL